MDEDFTIKAWGFSLDGHDFYILKLGTAGKNLVFDISTKQWSWWTDADEDFWTPAVGMKWDSSGSIAGSYGTNIVVGDADAGHLWVLDPEYGMDQRSDGVPETFTRIATAQITCEGRKIIPFFNVLLSATAGLPAFEGNLFYLEYSDDLGETYISAGTNTATPGDYEQEFTWRSLGIARAPGRIIHIIDDGSFPKIDCLDVKTGEKEDD